MRILALITARGGSKRIPGKNIRPLGGKPLIVWSINVATDINMISSRSDKKNQIYDNVKDKSSFEKLISLSKVYEKYISDHLPVLFSFD